MGRFFNVDAQLNPQVGLLGFNMFAYCGNNPVMGYDPTGHVDWGKFLSGVILIWFPPPIMTTNGISTAQV